MILFKTLSGQGLQMKARSSDDLAGMPPDGRSEKGTEKA